MCTALEINPFLVELSQLYGARIILSLRHCINACAVECQLHVAQQSLSRREAQRVHDAPHKAAAAQPCSSSPSASWSMEHAFSSPAGTTATQVRCRLRCGQPTHSEVPDGVQLQLACQTSQGLYQSCCLCGACLQNARKVVG